MRLAIFASSFHPHIGGVEELTRQLAHARQAAGHEVIVITNRWPPELPARSDHEGIAVYRFPMRIADGPLRARLRFALGHGNVERAITAALRGHRSELVHVQCVSTNGFYAARAAERLGLPLVVTAQGELTMDAERAYERPGGLNNVLRELLEKADRLTGCSQYVLDCLRDYRGAPFAQPASVIPNGISLEEFDDPAILPYRHRSPYVLGIGRWVPQKGFDVLIRAFASATTTPRFRHDLLLAGAGPEESRLRELVTRHAIADRVTFVGRADRRLTVSLFAGCSLFVLPSRLEPFGIVNLEAMAAKRPVIATAVGGVPEIVRHGQTGILVAPQDADGLAEAITHLTSDAATRHRLAETGRSVAADLTWREIATRYDVLYRELLAARA